MRKDRLVLILLGLIYSISLGSLVYIWPSYSELFIFLQIVILPAIYAIGFEILMDKQKKEFQKEYSKIRDEFLDMQLKSRILNEKMRRIKYFNNITNDYEQKAGKS